MFGSRLKTWMETYIGRPKKKVQHEPHKGKPNTNRYGGLILNSSESLAHSDTGISSGSQQVLSSSTTHYKEGYSTATTDSDKSALTQCHTAVSLPSPESAYSTGYSTDATSPGPTAPPEYYINIRTGKHYFPSPAPTPTSPKPHAAFPKLQPHHTCPPTSLPPRTLSRIPPPPPSPPLQTHLHIHPHKSTPSRTHSTSLKLFLRSPRFTPKPNTRNKPLSPPKPKKWFKQPFHKFAHRRMDPCNHIASAPSPAPTTAIHPTSLLPPQDTAASPRQRNRIKTNPWLPTAPAAPHNPQPAFPLPPPPHNRSCTNTPLQHRKSSHLLPLPPPHPPLHPRRPSSPELPLVPATALNVIDSTDRSDEDLTLNDMMGTFNESYVYEKETDILSDSDPTDCDDYDTDSDADKAGDERDSHDDELDFIDNASLTDSDDGFPPNTGRCSYHHLGAHRHPFLCNPDRRRSRKDSDYRRSLRKPQDLKGRRERRKQGGRRCSKCDGDDRKNFPDDSSWKAQIDENVGGLNLRRVLLERVMAKSATRGSGGSGVMGRKGRGDAGRRSEGSAPVSAVLLDEEADERYKELMEEAENMFENLRNSPVVMGRRKKSFPGGKDDEGGARAVEICKEADGTCCRQLQANILATPPRKTVKSLVLTLPVETARKSGNKISFKASSSGHSPLDPLGPTFRNFAVFHPVLRWGNQRRMTSSDDSDPTDAFNRNNSPCGAPDSPLVPISFQSLVLGKPIASYCPQSEPVKRKIYSCSKTYDRLVKHLEQNPQPLFHDAQPPPLPHTRTHPPL